MWIFLGVFLGYVWKVYSVIQFCAFPVVPSTSFKDKLVAGLITWIPMMKSVNSCNWWNDWDGEQNVAPEFWTNQKPHLAMQNPSCQMRPITCRLLGFGCFRGLQQEAPPCDKLQEVQVLKCPRHHHHHHHHLLSLHPSLNITKTWIKLTCTLFLPLNFTNLYRPMIQKQKKFWTLEVWDMNSYS